MKQFRILVCALAIVMATYATVPAAAQTEPDALSEGVPVEAPDKLLPDVDDGRSDQYVPPWANPNAPPPQIGVNDDPTPFNPSDVGDNPLFD